MNEMNEMRDIATRLAEDFAERAAEHDRDGSFPHENYDRMRETGYLRGNVPTELGGLGAGLAGTAEAQRALARGCASTALAVNMHLFQVGAAAEAWHAGGPTEPMLRSVADEGIVFGSTGAEAVVAGSWSTDTLAKHDGEGYVVRGRKFFCSQAPAMDVVRVNARDEETGEILVVAVPTSATGVEVVETWDTTGMRATASHDLLLDNVHVPDAAVGARLPAGKPTSSPEFAGVIRWFLAGVSGVYLGIADEARRIAHEALGGGRNSSHRDPALTDVMLGRLETTHFRAAAVFDAALARLDRPGDPQEDLGIAIVCKEEVTSAAAEVVDRAVEVVGGRSYFRKFPLERLVRDVRAAGFHPPSAPVSFQMVGERAREQYAGA